MFGNGCVCLSLCVMSGETCDECDDLHETEPQDVLSISCVCAVRDWPPHLHAHVLRFPHIAVLAFGYLCHLQHVIQERRTVGTLTGWLRVRKQARAFKYRAVQRRIRKQKFI